MLTFMIGKVRISGHQVLAAAAVAVVALAAACGSSAAGGRATAAPVTLRLGYFPDITHTPALVGVQDGKLAAALAPDRLDGRA